MQPVKNKSVTINKKVAKFVTALGTRLPDKNKIELMLDRFCDIASAEDVQEISKKAEEGYNELRRKNSEAIKERWRKKNE